MNDCVSKLYIILPSLWPQPFNLCCFKRNNGFLGCWVGTYTWIGLAARLLDITSCCNADVSCDVELEMVSLCLPRSDRR